MASGINQLNRLRLNGMVSGMDTQAIVTSMLKLEQMKIDKQMQAKAKQEWQRDSYREINNMFRSFRDEFMSVQNAAKNIQAPSNFKGFKVTTVGTNNAVTMTAGSGATTGSHTVNAVKQLATATNVKSGDKVSNTANGISSTDTAVKKLDLKTMIKAEGYQEAVVADPEADPPVEGKAYNAGKIEFTINSKTFKFTGDTTLQTIINTVNADKDANVTMSYSQLTDKLTIASKKTGENVPLSMSDTQGNFLAAFGVTGDDAVKESGLDAELYIDNQYVKRSTNNFTIDGISYNLNKEFNKDYSYNATTKTASGDDGTGITFTVTADTDKAMGVIKGFVEGYNSLILKLTSLLMERPNKAYPPLTQEQRDTLTESQQEKWEIEAKKGLLYNDPSLRRVLEDLRSTFFDKVGDTKYSLSDIGISPGSSVVEGTYVGTSSDIVIDEEKLRKMLERDPDMVMNLFTQTSKAAGKAAAYKEAGMSGKLFSVMNTYTSTIQPMRVSALDYSIKRASDMISQMETKMFAKEELLYKKYASMETAMAKWQSQGNWFSSQFS